MKQNLHFPLNLYNKNIVLYFIFLGFFDHQIEIYHEIGIGPYIDFFISIKLRRTIWIEM